MANLLETAKSNGGFEKLVDAIATTELTDLLTSPGPFTVLAPTDEAFSELPEGKLASLLSDHQTLKRVVMYHILPGDVRFEDLTEITEAPTEEGSVLAVEQSSDSIAINQAKVVKSDILADNGVIHVIDRVLIPGILEDNIES